MRDEGNKLKLRVLDIDEVGGNTNVDIFGILSKALLGLLPVFDDAV